MSVQVPVSTDYTHEVVIFDGVGEELTGVQPGDVVLWYVKAGSSSSTEKSLTTSNFHEVDATNLPGLYRVDFTASELDTEGFFIATLAPASGTSKDIENTNIRLEVVPKKKSDLSDEHTTIINKIDSIPTAASSSSVVKADVDLPEHFVSEVKKQTAYTFAFKIVGPNGPVTGMASSDISTIVTSNDTVLTGSDLSQSLTEIDSSAAPGWYALTLDSTDTANIGDLAVDIGFDNISYEEDTATKQTTPSSLATLPRVWARDQSEVYAALLEGGDPSTGQIYETLDGGENWGVLYERTGSPPSLFYGDFVTDIDGLEPDSGHYIALATTSDGKLDLVYNYGSASPQIKDLVDGSRDVLGGLSNDKVGAVSELNDRTWFTYFYVSGKGPTQTNYGVWDRHLGEEAISASSLNSSIPVEPADFYALTEEGGTSFDDVASGSDSAVGPSSIAVDASETSNSTGYLHASYVDNSNDRLVHAHDDAGFWQHTIIDNNNGTGTPTLLPTNGPELDIIYERGGHIYHGEYDFSNDLWSFSEITSATQYHSPDATIGDLADMHAVFMIQGSKQIYHAIYENGSWNIEVVWDNSGGTETAYNPTIEKSKETGGVEIFASHAEDGSNVNVVKKWVPTASDYSTWTSTEIENAGSVSEDEFSRNVGSAFDVNAAETVATYKRKNQDNATDPQLVYYDGSSLEDVKTTTFTHTSEVEIGPDGAFPGIMSDLNFYHEENGKPVLTHSSFYGGGYVTDVLLNDTNMDVPVGSSTQIVARPRFASFYSLAIDGSTQELVAKKHDQSFDDTLIMTGTDANGGGAIARSTDGGTTWNTVLTNSNINTIRRVDFYNNQTGYAVGDEGLVYKTTDGGQTWSEQYANSSFDFWGVYVKSETDIEFVGFRKSTNTVPRSPAHFVSSNSGVTSDRKRITEKLSDSNKFHSIDGSGPECWITGEDGEIIHCGVVTKGLGDRTYRFQIVEKYEQDTYTAVKDVETTVDDIDTDLGEPQTGQTTVFTELNEVDSTTNDTKSIANDIDNKIGTASGNQTTLFAELDDIETLITNVDGKVDSIQGTVQDIEVDVHDILDTVARILGLSQDNYQITDQTYGTYNGVQQLESATVYIYDNKSDLVNEQNEIGRYNLDATRDASGNLIDYKMSREL